MDEANRTPGVAGLDRAAVGERTRLLRRSGPSVSGRLRRVGDGFRDARASEAVRVRDRLVLARIGVTVAAVEELTDVQGFMEDHVSDGDRRKARANPDLGWPVASDDAVRNLTRLAEVHRLTGFGLPEPADPHARQAEVLRGVRQRARRGQARWQWDGRRIHLRTIEHVVVEDQTWEDADWAGLVQPFSNAHDRQASPKPSVAGTGA